MHRGICRPKISQLHSESGQEPDGDPAMFESSTFSVLEYPLTVVRYLPRFEAWLHKKPSLISDVIG